MSHESKTNARAFGRAPFERSVERLVTAHRQREGGGFLVRRPFPTYGFEMADPFLLLDEMGPVAYGPGEALGAPDHPHRGFETVTYLLEGEFEHEDSAGHRGALGPGDVQWMTAGSGVVHSEMPSKRLRELGGRLHGFQLWVNLPARDKLIAPRYQELPSSRIPGASSRDGLAQVRVIAGEALGVKAAIETRVPVVLQDWTLQPGAEIEQPIPLDHAAYLYVFGGMAEVGSEARKVSGGQLAVLGEGPGVRLAVAPSARSPARLLLLAGAPLNEPVARYGPFVMNTEEEISQAIGDFRAGRLGDIQRPGESSQR